MPWSDPGVRPPALVALDHHGGVEDIRGIVAPHAQRRDSQAPRPVTPSIAGHLDEHRLRIQRAGGDRRGHLSRRARREPAAEDDEAGSHHDLAALATLHPLHRRLAVSVQKSTEQHRPILARLKPRRHPLTRHVGTRRAVLQRAE